MNATDRLQQLRDNLPEHYKLNFDEHDKAPNFGSEKTGLIVYVDGDEYAIYTESGTHVQTTKDLKLTLKKLDPHNQNKYLYNTEVK